jgi:PST family polysaccharide transporter
LYQSAWTIGGLYVGFILQAMGADFYPRLTAVANDNAECNRLVNEQTRVGLLLAGPGAIATLTFAPLVMELFYTCKFGAAVGVLRWICLGTTLQVISWPMGFIILAKGKQNIFVFSDLAWTIFYVGIAWLCLNLVGLSGAGISFFGAYIFHGFLTYLLVSRLSGFRWSNENKRTGLLFICSITCVFFGFRVLPFRLAICVGIISAAINSVYSIRLLTTLISFDCIPQPIRQLLVAFGRRWAVIKAD